MEHQSSLKTLRYEDEELDEHEDDAKDAHLEFLGTIHSHPDCSDNRFGDHDLATMQESQESVMGILAIEAEVKGKKLKKRRCHIAFWPSTRPLEVVRKEWDASSSKKIKRPRRVGTKLKYAKSSRKRRRR
jgi:hypothetical protein